MISLVSKKQECCVTTFVIPYVEMSFMKLLFFPFFSKPACNRDVSVKST